MAPCERQSFLVPAELEELFTAHLWAQGTQGCEIHPAEAGWLRVEAFFPQIETTAFDVAVWEPRGVRQLAVEAVTDTDWMAAYRAQATPFTVGRFLIDPRDEEESAGGPDAAARFFLHIPAQTAFGTGSHATTRLALAWLEALDLAGRDVLDVGTGSAILAFAALRLGARRAVGFDVDAPAVVIARHNAVRNRLAPQLFAGRSQALAGHARFDVVVVNVLPEKITAELSFLTGLLRPGGAFISSGNLQVDRASWLLRLASAGLELAGEKHDEEWAAYLLHRR